MKRKILLLLVWGAMVLHAQENTLILTGSKTNNQFSSSMVTIDDYVFIGMPNSTEIGSLGVVDVYEILQNRQPKRIFQLKDPIPEGMGQYGNVMATNGRSVFIASPLLNNESGVIYAYDIKNKKAILQQKIESSLALSSNQFGRKIAMNKDRAFVSSIHGKKGEYKAGSVQSYVLKNNRWIEEQYIENPEIHEYADFGSSLLSTKQGIFIGAKGANQNADLPSTGAVYWYELNGKWQIKQKIIAQDAYFEDGFGEQMVYYNDMLIVSAPGKTQGHFEKAGAVYVYKLTNGYYKQVQKISLPMVFPNTLFGASIIQHDSQIWIGALLDTKGNYGVLYPYKHDGKEWVSNGNPIVCPQTNDGSSFGQKTYYYNEQLWVGMPDASVDSSLNVGKMFIYPFAPAMNLVNNTQDSSLVAFSKEEHLTQQTINQSKTTITSILNDIYITNHATEIQKRTNNSLELQLYPNPTFSGEFYLKTNQELSSNCQIQILDIVGQKVRIDIQKIDPKYYHIYIPNAKSGIYYLIIGDNEYSNVKKISVLH